MPAHRRERACGPPSPRTHPLPALRWPTGTAGVSPAAVAVIAPSASLAEPSSVAVGRPLFVCFASSWFPAVPRSRPASPIACPSPPTYASHPSPCRSGSSCRPQGPAMLLASSSDSPLRPPSSSVAVVAPSASLVPSAVAVPAWRRGSRPVAPSSVAVGRPLFVCFASSWFPAVPRSRPASPIACPSPPTYASHPSPCRSGFSRDHPRLFVSEQRCVLGVDVHVVVAASDAAREAKRQLGRAVLLRRPGVATGLPPRRAVLRCRRSTKRQLGRAVGRSREREHLARSRCKGLIHQAHCRGAIRCAHSHMCRLLQSRWSNPTMDG